MAGMSIAITDAQVRAMLDQIELALLPGSLVAFLEGDVQDYLAEQIEWRFAFEGDRASGDWDRLSEATVHIREQAGFMGDSPINERTGELLRYLTEHYDGRAIVGGAELQIPGDVSGTMEDKIRHAQVGAQPGENPLFPNSETPPRPVLALDEMDLEKVIELLSLYIVGFVLIP